VNTIFAVEVDGPTGDATMRAFESYSALTAELPVLIRRHLTDEHRNLYLLEVRDGGLHALDLLVSTPPAEERAAMEQQHQMVLFLLRSEVANRVVAHGVYFDPQLPEEG
jgi:stress-induced morphogen